MKHYCNKFGSLSLRPVTEVMHVRDIRGENVADEHKFDVETAEKIVLIAENRRVQVCPGRDWRCYVILHESASTGAVAAVENLTYTGGTPAEEIHAMRRPAAC